MFKTLENKDSYNVAGYSTFRESLMKSKADWDEFFPKPLESSTDTVLVRIKKIGEDSYEVFHLPNTRLYMLKNEIRYGAYYGFACTDFFNAMRAINHTTDWFSAEANFKVYPVKTETNDYRKVIDYSYKDDLDKSDFVKLMFNLASSFGKTNQLMLRWSRLLEGKVDKQLVMNRFGSYSKIPLTLCGVDSDNYAEGEGVTKYHFFHQISKANDLQDFKKLLTVYNLNFEMLVNNFERFLFTFNRKEIFGDNTSLKSVARKVILN